MAEAFRLHIWNGETEEAKKIDDWIGFPCSPEEFKSILQVDGFTDEQIKNCVIDGYLPAFPEYSDVNDFFSSTDHPYKENGYIIRESIDELNYLAHFLCSFGETDRAAFAAAIEAGEHNKSLAELINLAQNVECYNVVEEIYDWEDYGKYVAKEECNVNVDYLGELADYVDFERFGEEYAKRHSGHLLDDKFLETDCATYVVKYDGEVENIPDRFRISLFADNEQLLDYKVKEALSLANSLDRYFTAHDKDYAARYPDGRVMSISEMLINGDLHYIKSMLNNLADDILLGEVAEYEKKFLKDNYLANAEKHTEQNFNQIDGLMNNEPPKKEEKPSIRLMLKIIVQEVKDNKDKNKDHKPPQRSGPEL